ncbi:MAG: hypothetical protein GF317_05780 [Candidatus Lokiarchaeota archaeon]|nr:hypothetical protein [Candidatus Lokiarchaeota archaeon]
MNMDLTKYFISPEEERNQKNLLKNKVIEIKYDYREDSKIIELLHNEAEELGIEIDMKCEELYICDYICGQIGIELKSSLADWLDSLTRDNRLESQYQRMVEADLTCAIVVVDNPFSTINGYTKKHVLNNAQKKGFISWMAKAFVSHINMIYLEEKKQFARFCLKSFYYQNIKPPGWRISKKAPLFSIKCKLTPAQRITIAQLMGIPGIGQTMATDLTLHFNSIKNIMLAEIKDITEVSGIGPKTAQLITSALNGEYNPND